ncbi:MAG: sigma-70 family RNA polymerase sigma factor [Patescibacteria group bacterium]
MDISSDTGLIEAAKNNPEHFGLLYEKYSEKVFNFFYFHVNFRRDVAEDLRQETFLKAFTKISQFSFTNNTSSYLTYLLTIAHNLLVNYYRDCEKTISLDERPELVEGVTMSLEAHLDIEVIKKVVHELPLYEKEIFLLRYEIQLSITEIAQAIQKTENAVKLMLSRARKKLAQHPSLKDMVVLQHGYNHS